MRVIEKLVYGFYLLQHRWKKDSDRRLAVSAALATSFVVILISTRSVLGYMFASVGIAYDADVPEVFLLVVLGAVWFVMDRFVVTDQVYSEIRMSSVTEPKAIEARSFAVKFLWVTLLLMVAALIVAVLQ